MTLYTFCRILSTSGPTTLPQWGARVIRWSFSDIHGARSHPRRHWGNLPGWPKRHIASKNVSSGARGKRVWPTMRCAIGPGGSTIKRYRYWRRGSWYGKPSGGKKRTPAITLPQIRQGIALILYEVFQCGTLSQRLKECQQRLQRNELARFYPWKQRNLLAPLNLYNRQF